jgi:hypothetical protein
MPVLSRRILSSQLSLAHSKYQPQPQLFLALLLFDKTAKLAKLAKKGLEKVILKLCYY